MHRSIARLDFQSVPVSEVRRAGRTGRPDHRERRRLDPPARRQKGLHRFGSGERAQLQRRVGDLFGESAQLFGQSGIDPPPQLAVGTDLGAPPAAIRKGKRQAAGKLATGNPRPDPCGVGAFRIEVAQSSFSMSLAIPSGASAGP